MSIILIRDFPITWTLKEVVKELMRVINEDFGALRFVTAKGTKLCYLKLSQNSNALRVVQKINEAGDHLQKVTAFIPKRIPDFISNLQPTTMPKKFRRKFCNPVHVPSQVLVSTLIQILNEVQSKYTRLYHVSKRTGHKLMDKYVQVIVDRLKTMIVLNRDLCEDPFVLTKLYRKAHPHFGDFQCILSILHQVEDESNKPRSQMVESDLIAVSYSPYAIDNIAYDKIVPSYHRYTEQIAQKVEHHIEGLDAEIKATDSADETAQKEVRQELKKLKPYMKLIIKQVVLKYIKPERRELHKARIYGEPIMPSKEVMMDFLTKYKITSFKRSAFMYNLLTLTVPTAQYPNLLARDGSVVGGAKLIIRPLNSTRYMIPTAILAELKAVGEAGGAGGNKMDADD